jgi:DNA-binding MltR family transcriptional regulator
MSEDSRFLEESPHLKEFIQLLAIVRKESDRGAVMVHVSMLDELLKRSVEARLVDHAEVEKLTEGFNAPIGTLAARALLAFAVGVISEVEYREAEQIRKIRNHFAHSVEMSFADDRVTSRCNLLTYAIRDTVEKRISPRDKFITASTSLILSLVNRAHYVEQRRLFYGGWKH